MTHKRCPGCKTLRPLSDFAAHKRDGRQSRCRDCRKRPGAPDAAPAFDGRENVKRDETPDALHVETLSTRVRTVEQAIAKGGVDTAVWEVERFTLNSWEVALKQDDGSAATAPLWQVKVWFRRKVSRIVELAAAELLARMAKFAPAAVKRPKFAKVRDPHLCEISLYDVHFGKLAWAAETGSDYDLRIARGVYDGAVANLLAMTEHVGVERFLIPVGNDFFHVDNALNTTAHGTRQDVDGRLAKVFRVGCEAVIDAVNRCLTVAPVELVWVPGNHDPATSWYMAEFLRAHFRNERGVTVDAEPTSRKYRRFGSVLLGFTHGCEEAHRDLPAIMAGEVPDEWAAATHREWHLGHFHKRKQTQYNAGDTFGGVTVRVLPSLSGTDAWHFSKGYVKSPRAAEAYLWSKADGYVGHFSTNVKAAA